jgi:transcriptional regulator with PAS, ATPase and Fis domain
MKDQLESLVNLMVEQGIRYEDAVVEFEKRFIKRVLEKNGGNHTKAAETLGIHRNTLSRKIEELDLDRRPPRRKRPARPLLSKPKGRGNPA